MGPKTLQTCHTLQIFFRLFPRRIITRFAVHLRKSVRVLCFYVYIQVCLVKLSDEVCASHTKREGEKKSFYKEKTSVFTSQEVRRSAAHLFILLKLF